MREVLATEMLEALGVNTSKSFALFETGEALDRGDEPSPTRSAVLTRLSHGHIRIGTFQRLAFLGQVDHLTSLTRYVLEHLYGEPRTVDDGENAERLFDQVSARQPRRLPLPISRPASSTASSIATISTSPARASTTGPGASPRLGARVHRRLFRPSRAVRVRPSARSHPLGSGATGRLPVADRQAPALSELLAGWSARFEQALAVALIARLGIDSGERDRDVAGALIGALATRAIAIDRIFFDWRGGRDPGAERYPAEAFRALGRAARRPGPAASASLLVGRRPLLDADRRGRSDLDGDCRCATTGSRYNNKVNAIRRMGAAVAQDAPQG